MHSPIIRHPAAEAPRPVPPEHLTPQDLASVAGGKGLTIVCIEHKGQLVCQMI